MKKYLNDEIRKLAHDIGSFRHFAISSLDTGAAI